MAAKQKEEDGEDWELVELVCFIEFRVNICKL
jgi:hypothetical protein